MLIALTSAKTIVVIASVLLRTIVPALKEPPLKTCEPDSIKTILAMSVRA
jgi:hypothetical protein